MPRCADELEDTSMDILRLLFNIIHPTWYCYRPHPQVKTYGVTFTYSKNSCKLIWTYAAGDYE